jgi:hypothetical protein
MRRESFFALLLQLHSLLSVVTGERLDNTIKTTLRTSDQSEFEFQYDYHWETPKAEIRVKLSLSLEDSFYGKQVQISTSRNVLPLHIARD